MLERVEHLEDSSAPFRNEVSSYDGDPSSLGAQSDP
jgi:hypothetical protein